ncbi:LuxR C-terminal-related transcriptional regulator [Arthrobacter alpinus]|nr:LuxR C-terminal-related transcriptional regulator [Arthrobacter alpinus]
MELSAAAADQLTTYTAGNIHTALELIRENPDESWNHLNHRFPAPRAVSAGVAERLQALSTQARSVIEAAAILGNGSRLDAVVTLAEVDEPLPLVEECVASTLVEVAGSGGNLHLMFTGNIKHMAVYHLIPYLGVWHCTPPLPPWTNARVTPWPTAPMLHCFPILRCRTSWNSSQRTRRARASGPPQQPPCTGLPTSQPTRPNASRCYSRPSMPRWQPASCPRAGLFRGTGFLAASPESDLLSGYIAILQGQALTADRWLSRAWTGAEDARQTKIMATVSQRRVLDSLGRLDGLRLVEWAERTLELADEGSPVAVESSAIQGLGLGMLGRGLEGEKILDRMLATLPTGAQRQRAEMAMGWLHVAGDQIELARHELTISSSTDYTEGSHRIALWARAWLARAEYSAGDWDQALETVRAGIALQERSGIELVRPLLHYTAVQIHAMRGEHEDVEAHLAKAWARTGSYEVMQVPYRMARAAAARARADYDEVILALEPLLLLDRSRGIDEPGFWPWHDMYADALVRKERFDEAQEFMEPLMAAARKRKHRSTTARFLVVRGQVLGTHGDLEGSRDAFEDALAQLRGLTLPVLRANIEYAYGQSLRRAGKRGESAGPLTRALAGYTQLGATIYIERCNRELQATGISVPRRDAADWSSLTSQEKAVASLVCAGASNKKTAEELFIGSKTVQYHLTRIYSKLGVTSRTELAARYRDTER